MDLVTAGRPSVPSLPEADVTEAAAFIVESGPLIQIVRLEYISLGGAEAGDVEKHANGGESGGSRLTRRRGYRYRQRMQCFLILCLISACLTFLTVVGLDALRMDHYLAS